MKRLIIFILLFACYFGFSQGRPTIPIGTFPVPNGLTSYSFIAQNAKADTVWFYSVTDKQWEPFTKGGGNVDSNLVILNQSTSPELKSFWTKTGRVDNFFGVNTTQNTTEAFGVNGSSLLNGTVNVKNGGIVLTNTVTSGNNNITLQDDAGRIFTIRLHGQGGFIGTETQHSFSFMAGGSIKMILNPVERLPQFPALYSTSEPTVYTGLIKTLVVDAAGRWGWGDMWPQYRDSINGRFSFILDPMMYAAYDPNDPTKLDTLGVYTADTSLQRNGIIKWQDLRSALRGASDPETIQDMVSTFIQNGTGISWSYNDGSNTFTPTVSLSPFSTSNLSEGSNLYFTNTRVNTQLNTYTGDVTFSGGVSTIGASKVLESMLGLTDVTTANVSTTKHGLTPKLPNDATKFLNGAGAWAVPSGGFTNNGTTDWTAAMKALSRDTATGNYYQVAMTSIDMSTFTDGSFVKYDATNNKFIAGTPAGGTGESNTMSSVGGAISVYNNKVGVNFEMKSFNASDFDSASNVISIDATLKSTWNGKQNALNGGTGYVKSTAGVISYDNTTYTPTSRTITINGTALDLSANRSWTIAASDLLPSYTGNNGKVLGLVAGALTWVSQTANDGNKYATGISALNGIIQLTFNDASSISVTASGTWGIGISGNAATVTNGVYTTTTYDDPAWLNTLAASKITGTKTSSFISNFTAAVQSVGDARYQTLANLSTTTTLGTSNTLYPSQLAVKTYVDNAISAAGGYTDENAQDAIGAMVSSEFTYTDATPSLAINAIAASKITGLATVATSGSYNDLSNRPITSLGTANQLLRVNASATALEYFTPSYITSNQTITLSGDVSGSGSTGIAATVNGLKGVSIPALSTGFLYYNGSQWDFVSVTGGGEANTASNVAATVNANYAGFYKTKSGVDLQFKSLSTPTDGGIIITGNTNEVEAKNSGYAFYGKNQFSTSSTGTTTAKHFTTLPAYCTGVIEVTISGNTSSGGYTIMLRRSFRMNAGVLTYGFENITKNAETIATFSAPTIAWSTSGNTPGIDITPANTTTTDWNITYKVSLTPSNF